VIENKYTDILAIKTKISLLWINMNKEVINYIFLHINYMHIFTYMCANACVFNLYLVSLY